MNKELLLSHMNSYQGISSMLRECSYDEISEAVVAVLNTHRSILEQYPMGGYSKGKRSGAWQYVLRDLIQNIDYYDWVFTRLADEESKRVFTNLIQFRIVPDMQFIESAFDPVNHQYFDKAIVSCSTDEVFVDCGGFTGDTTEDFIRQYQHYKKIYVYEPSGDNIAVCRENLKQYRDVEVHQCGVGEKEEKLIISGSGSSSSFVGAEQAAEDSDTIAIISLDGSIKEPVTFIKMDIEGFEIPAIIGAKHHIQKDSPKLAICTYHIISDMWEIPKLIDSINPNYDFYFRHYMKTQNWETVLYAIPKQKGDTAVEHRPEAAKAGEGQPKRIMAMAPYPRGWSNVELVKDCGLIPYLLHKNHGHEVTMIGADGKDYSNQKYIEGVKLEFLADGEEQTKLEYMAEHARQIDCLILRGCYSSNFNVANIYKQVNPEGRIYVGLDANSHWMDRIIWTEEHFSAFMDCCDVIATSCTAMQKHLNEKWPWKIERIFNGFYHFGRGEIKPDFDKKENTILTVSRLGTEQKMTNMLLEAFAMIAPKIPDWKLRLTGTVEKSFKEYIEQYFKRFPELKERCIFTGPIQERDALFEEYLNAKIFALPSSFEGGTPNVIAEALNASCVIAITKIDAYEDAIDSGRCGMACDLFDTEGFAQILLSLCTHEDLRELSAHAYEHGSTNFNMEQIVARLNEMLFGGK